MSKGRQPIDLVSYGVLRERADLLDLLLTDYEAFTGGKKALDEFLCYPDEAIDYCNQIRARPDLRRLPDNVILRLLMNYRKAASRRK